jgi:hypothetical protein
MALVLPYYSGQDKPVEAFSYKERPNIFDAVAQWKEGTKNRYYNKGRLCYTDLTLVPPFAIAGPPNTRPLPDRSNQPPPLAATTRAAAQKQSSTNTTQAARGTNNAYAVQGKTTLYKANVCLLCYTEDASDNQQCKGPDNMLVTITPKLMYPAKDLEGNPVPNAKVVYFIYTMEALVGCKQLHCKFANLDGQIYRAMPG